MLGQTFFLMDIKIKKVATNADLRKFIHFPFTIYSGNKYWCPPLRLDEKQTLRKDKNPAFEFCEAEYWLAYKDKKLVGRIAGIINHRANSRWNEKLVRFGWIDFIDEPEISGKLIETVENWGRKKGMNGIHGPLGFSDMDNEGMLIDGFNELSNISTIYNYPYYPEHMEKMGFLKAADWVQFEITITPEVPDKVQRMAALVEKKYNLHVLKATKAKELRPYAKKMFIMLNMAFDSLYGYSQLSEKQIDVYIKQYFGFIRSEFVTLVLDTKDDIVAFGIALPSLTKAIQRGNGRLFPFGFIHLLSALKWNHYVDMALVGVRPDYQAKGGLAMVYRNLHQSYIDNKIVIGVTNPQLEENVKALSIWKNFKARQHMIRRCWIRRFTD
jgi:hypothetical protein